MAARQSTPGALLRRYFRSGWAFFVPYLAVFLLYAWRGWPVGTTGVASSGPTLLRVYWLLHGLHLGLLSIALWVCPERDGAGPRRWLPWILIALIFLIPGVYLEYPADPWVHLERIMRWTAQATITTPYKDFSYFLIYSLTGCMPTLLQPMLLDLSYAAMCLLLCWQYFRLALAVGLGRRAALVFVVLQTVLLGNSIFSFHRYYGIASTILSQIAAMALIRLGLESGSWLLKSDRSRMKLLPAVGAGLLLTALIAIDHVQGLGIAALGLAAIGLWLLLAWRRAAIYWVAAAALALSIVAILWFPRQPEIDGSYRVFGWINRWHGFDLLSAHGPATDRMLQILGGIGVLNLIAGAFLAWRNHVIGWITILPVLALSLPFVAIPFAGLLARHNEVITFHRMFLEIPSGLALAVLVSSGLNRRRSAAWAGRFASFGPCACLILALFALVTVPANGPFYNRFWHALEKTPTDLRMTPVADEFDAYARSNQFQPSSMFASNSWISSVVEAKRPVWILCKGRLYYNDQVDPAGEEVYIQHTLEGWSNQNGGHVLPLVLIVPSPLAAYSAYSQAALLSQHWLPQEVALAFCGADGLRAVASTLRLQAASPAGATSYFQYFGR